MFIAVIGLPFVFTAPVAFLSGDKGLFSALPYSVKLSAKYYFVNMRSIGIILLAILLVDFTFSTMYVMKTEIRVGFGVDGNRTLVLRASSRV